MPESKPAPAADAPPAKGRLSHRAPPKPERRNSSIPAALVTSTTASRIPPAPKPPRRIPAAKPEPAPRSTPRIERESERPVAAEVTDTRKQEASTGRRWAVPLLLAAGVVGLGGFILQQRSADNEPVSESRTEHKQVSAAKADEAKRQAPTADSRTVFRSIDLDEPVGAETAAAAAESGPGTRDQAADEPAALVPTEPATAAQGPAEASVTQEPSADPEPSVAAKADEEATAESDAAKTGEPGEPALGKPQLPAFDTEVARAVLSASASKASSCRRGDDPRGTAEVLITFAPSGRVTSATVNGEPFGGTATGGCVASTMRQATVPAFSGDHVTVRKLVKIH